MFDLTVEALQGLQYLACAVTALVLAVEADVYPLSTTSTIKVIIVCATTLAAY